MHTKDETYTLNKPDNNIVLSVENKTDEVELQNEDDKNKKIDTKSNRGMHGPVNESYETNRGDRGTLGHGAQ